MGWPPSVNAYPLIFILHAFFRRETPSDFHGERDDFPMTHKSGDSVTAILVQLHLRCYCYCYWQLWIITLHLWNSQGLVVVTAIGDWCYIIESIVELILTTVFNAIVQFFLPSVRQMRGKSPLLSFVNHDATSCASTRGLFKALISHGLPPLANLENVFPPFYDFYCTYS